MKRRFWTQSDIDKLKKHYPTKNVAELSDVFPNRTNASVNIMASKMKIKKKKGFYVKNADLSVLLDGSLQSWYWLGFLLADGHFSKEGRLIFELCEKDKGAIESFSSYIRYKGKKSNRVQVQDKKWVVDIANLIGVRNNKTVFPSTYRVKQNPIGMALYVGFIDGDGSIKRIHKRKDCSISIKLYKTWLPFIEEMEINIYKYFQIERKKKNGKPLSKINNAGYAFVSFSDFEVLKSLKLFITENKLDVLDRKWNLIDENFKGRKYYEKYHRKIIKEGIEDGLSIYAIIKKHRVKPSTLYNMARRDKIKEGLDCECKNKQNK